MIIRMGNNDGDNDDSDICYGFIHYWPKNLGKRHGASLVIDTKDGDEGGGDANHNAGDNDDNVRWQCQMNELKRRGSLPERWLTGSSSPLSRPPCHSNENIRWVRWALSNYPSLFPPNRLPCSILLSGLPGNSFFPAIQNERKRRANAKKISLFFTKVEKRWNRERL